MLGFHTVDEYLLETVAKTKSITNYPALLLFVGMSIVATPFVQ